MPNENEPQNQDEKTQGQVSTPPEKTETQETKGSNEKTETSLINQGKELEKKEEVKEEAKKDGEKPTIPEKYEFKVPENYELNEEKIAEVTPILKELGVSQEGAQKLFDFFAKQQVAAEQAPLDLWKQTQQDWVKEIKADPEIGGKLDQVLGGIKKAVDTHLPPELAGKFRHAMDFTGAGNNPDIIRGMNILVQQLGEGKHVPAGGPTKESQKAPGTGAEQSVAQTMYPHLPSIAR